MFSLDPGRDPSSCDCPTGPGESFILLESPVPSILERGQTPGRELQES